MGRSGGCHSWGQGTQEEQQVDEGGVLARVLRRNRTGRICVCVCLVHACPIYECVHIDRRIDVIHFEELTYPIVGAGSVFHRRAGRLETQASAETVV